jgi:hypothetical protein
VLPHLPLVALAPLVRVVPGMRGAAVPLTWKQKCHAMAFHVNQPGNWTPVAGDYYTSVRPDLEVYQVVSIDGGVVSTRYVEPPQDDGSQLATWSEQGFLSDGYGPSRVWLPAWALEIKDDVPC